jgi:hypothetical protein
MDPSTLLAFHRALVRRKYRRLFSSTPGPKKPRPKGPDEALIRAIVELKSRNPRFGCPRMAHIISQRFGIDELKTVPHVPLSHPVVERLIGTTRRIPRPGAVLDGRDLERKLAEFKVYDNAARGHVSLEGHTPLAFARGYTAVPADLIHVRGSLAAGTSSSSQSPPDDEFETDTHRMSIAQP